MSVRSLTLFFFIMSALSSTPVLAADRGKAPAPSIEMSASAGDSSQDAFARQGWPPQLQDDASAPQADEPGAESEPEEAAPADAAPADAPKQAPPVAAPEAAKLAPTAGPDVAMPAPTAAPDAAAATPAAAVAGNAAAPAPSGAAAAGEPVPWWREAASLLGLAADPHPGETAEPAPGRPQTSPDYVIGPGDLLGISVWRDENLTRSVVVLPDGKIAYPLVGDLVAGGKTLAQLKAELERKLARYITDAGLTVEVKQSNSMIIYILGRVNAPGRQMMVATTNVLQGLAMAGGLNPYARRSEVKVYRKQEGKTSVFSFNYDDVSEGRHLETNIDLQKGDVILVP